MKKAFIFIILIFLLVSCGLSDLEIQVMLKETLTALPTITPLPTYTLFPTQTPKIIFVTATSSPTPTATLTPTQPPYSPQEMTATVVSATKEYKALFVPIPYKELRDYADNYVGEKTKVKGRVMQVANNHTVLVYFTGTYDIFYVEMIPELSEIYEDNNIVVYGEVEGDYCYSTAAGGTNCVPLITGEWYE